MTSSSNTRKLETLPALDIENLEDDANDITQEDINTFEVYTPIYCKLATVWPMKVKCPGCLKIFPSKPEYVYHPTFYHHCIKDCEKYQQLGEDT